MLGSNRYAAADFSDHCPSKQGEDITEMSVEDRNFNDIDGKGLQ